MPVDREVSKLSRLSRRLLVAILTEVIHTEFDEVPHERRRVKLGNHDESDVISRAFVRPRSVIDRRANALQALP
ncbi:hypothetical protein [Homoserinimonas hongtaonis]|uniref:hypothetical protein n=1 Tax=Homoserinimonas hongtaonis TaxID=2079791 RepID=UPI001F547E5B|nr:hypothetical protein [Salinibacterium hongtaonis]